jgi:hypothetical protein
MAAGLSPVPHHSRHNTAIAATEDQRARVCVYVCHNSQLLHSSKSHAGAYRLLRAETAARAQPFPTLQFQSPQQ